MSGSDKHNDKHKNQFYYVDILQNRAFLVSKALLQTGRQRELENVFLPNYILPQIKFTPQSTQNV